eukprot:jgi/Ulvmu1/12187/UM085_0051.1
MIVSTLRPAATPSIRFPVSAPRRALTVTCACAQVEEAVVRDWRDFVVKFQPHKQSRVEAPPQTPPVVILPGFGNRSTDYTSPFGEETADESLASALESRGFQCNVVPVLRKDWLRVAQGITSLDFWRCGLTTHPSYSWYLQRLKSTVRDALETSGAEQVILVGHSAGGWLGRAFLGDSQWFVGEAHVEPNEWVPGPGTFSPVPNPCVQAIVTLGTPQRPPPADLGRDMTGGAQSWVESNYPGAFYKSHGVKYVCVGGKTVTGRQRDKRNRAERPTPPSYAYNAYTQVCGEGQDVIGDAVVPLPSIFLDEATNIEIPGVFHSMSKVGTYDSPGEYPWYGSPEVVDLWLAPLLAELEA